MSLLGVFSLSKFMCQYVSCYWIQSFGLYDEINETFILVTNYLLFRDF
jgi:hypothetical protein